MAPDRPLIEKALSRGNAPAHAHPRKPGNLLVDELGIKLVGQFVREFRFVHPDRLVGPRTVASYIGGSASIIMPPEYSLRTISRRLGPLHSSTEPNGWMTQTPPEEALILRQDASLRLILAPHKHPSRRIAYSSSAPAEGWTIHSWGPDAWQRLKNKRARS